MESQERRKYPRVNVSIRTDTAPDGIGGTWPAEVVGMTLEGLTLRLNRRLEPGTECAFKLEGGPRFSGTVIHSRTEAGRTQAGISIASLPPVEKLKLSRFISHHRIPAG